MKKIRWRKLKKQAFDHPYFEYKKHLLSEKEAEDILAGGDALGVDEFMRIVRERAERQDIDTRISLPQPERKERLPKRRLITRLAVAAVAVLLIFAFLTLTEPGIAFAEAVRNFVVNIIDGNFQVQGRELPSDLPDIDYENIPETFESLEQAARVIGRPVTDLSQDNIVVSSINAYVVGNLMNLTVEYQTNRGETLSMAQWFPSEGSSWGFGASAGSGEVVERTLENGIVLYAGNMDDGTSFVDGVAEGIYLSIASVDLASDDLLNIVSEMRLISPDNFENIPETFASLEEAANVIGRPVADVCDQDSILTSITANVIDAGAVYIKTYYEWKQGLSYSVIQTFYSDNSYWSVGSNIGENDVIERDLSNGVTLYSGHMEDGAPFIDAYGADIILNIRSTNISSEDLLNYRLLKQAG